MGRNLKCRNRSSFGKRAGYLLLLCFSCYWQANAQIAGKPYSNQAEKEAYSKAISDVGVSVVAATSENITYSFSLTGLKTRQDAKAVTDQFMVKEGIVSCDPDIKTGTVLVVAEQKVSRDEIRDIVEVTGYQLILIPETSKEN